MFICCLFLNLQAKEEHGYWEGSLDITVTG